MTQRVNQQQLRSEFLKAAVETIEWSENSMDRMVAANVIGTLGNTQHVEMLLEILKVDDNRQVKHKVSQAIARIGGVQAKEGLQQLMYVDDPYTRFLAAESLADVLARGTV